VRTALDRERSPAPARNSQSPTADTQTTLAQPATAPLEIRIPPRRWRAETQGPDGRSTPADDRGRCGSGPRTPRRDPPRADRPQRPGRPSTCPDSQASSTSASRPPTNTPAAPATRHSHQRTAPTPRRSCENLTRSNLPPGDLNPRSRRTVRTELCGQDLAHPGQLEVLLSAHHFRQSRSPGYRAQTRRAWARGSD
jgi:hypothetical protein